MNPRQLEQIPSGLLADFDTRPLIAWLWERGWPMTLHELAEERARRQIVRRVVHY